MIPFIVFVIITSISGYAQHFDPGVVHVLEAMNEGQSKINYTGAVCAIVNPINADSSKINARDMNECVVALCGLPTENKSVYVTNSNFDQYITAELKTKIDKLVPDLNKALDKTQKINQEIAAAIEKQIFKDGAINSNPKQWSDDFRSHLSKTIFEPFLEISINLEMPIGKRLQVKANPSAKASEEFKEQLEEYAGNYAFYSNNNYNQFMEKGLYSESEMISLARERLKKLNILYHDEFKKISEIDRKFYESSAKSTEEMMASPGEENAYSIFSNLEYMEEEASKYEPSLKISTRQPVCSNESKCEKIYQKHLEQQNIDKRLAVFKQRLVDPKVREKALNNCKAQIIATATTAADKTIAARIVKQVKQQISENVFAKFSNHSREILKNYFDDNIKTSPKTLESYVKEEKDSLLKFKYKLNGYIREDSSGIAAMSQEVALAQALNIADDPDDINALSDASNPCSGTPMNNAWDSYLASDKIKNMPKEHRESFGDLGDLARKDHIFISDFTCHHELRGRSIIAHELGHAINQIFATSKLSEQSAKTYKSLRSCATENYVDFIPDMVHFSQTGDGLRTEEDTADLLAYMTFADKNDLFTCSLVKSSFNEKSYDDLNLIMNDGDSHSTPFFRLIMEAANKGIDLPISCQKAIEPMKDKMRVRKCIH